MSQKGLFSQVLRTGLRRYSVSHTFDSASSQSDLVIAGEISKSVQKRPKVSKSDQKLAHCMALTRFWEFPKLNMQFPGNFQKCPKAPKSCQKLPKVSKHCQSDKAGPILESDEIWHESNKLRNHTAMYQCTLRTSPGTLLNLQTGSTKKGPDASRTHVTR